jgi:putative peptidoglycan lipid II flippase
VADDASQGEAYGPSPEFGSGRQSALVAVGILLSRLTGLVRERAIGHFFGTGFAADAFAAAFRIPNLLQNLLGEGVLSASFIPVYSKLLAEGRDEEAGQVAGAVAGLLAAVTGLLVLAGVLFARPIMAVLAPGFGPQTFELAVLLMQVITPGIGFLVLSAWCLGVLNSHRRFFLSYVAPVLWNVAQIAVLVGVGLTVYAQAFADPGQVREAQAGLVVWLAWGTVLGAALQLAVQLPTVIRVARGLRPSLRTDLPGVRRAARAFVPIVGGRGVVQIQAYVVDVFLATFLAIGALAALRYGQMLYLLPISLFGMSVAAAELPELSRIGDKGRELLQGRLGDGMARIAFFVAPTTLGYLVIGDLIVATVFQTGEFDALVVIQVWAVLAAYSVGLLASTASRLLQSALYGIGDAVTPAKVAVARVVLSVVFGVVLMFQLDRVIVVPDGLQLLEGETLPAFGPLPEEFRDEAVSPGFQHLGAAGLALGAGIAAWLEYHLLRRAVGRRIGPAVIGGGRLRRLVLPLAAFVVVALAARPLVAGLHPLLAGALAVAAAGGAYVLVARWLGVPEARSLDRIVRRLTGR